MTATQLAALNQAVAAGLILPGYKSLESFCEDWKRLTVPQRVNFDFTMLQAEMDQLGVPNTNKLIEDCLWNSVG